MENNLSYYKIFYAVAQTGNISKAAKELYISQPAISKVINKLEQSLHAVLFIRNSRGVKLTYEGELLYEQCKIAFQAIGIGEMKVKNAMEQNIGQLRIGVSTTLCKNVLLPHLQRFINRYPNIKMNIECQATYEILTLLEAGSIDIGLVAKPAALKNLSYFSMGEIQDIFVASPHYLNLVKGKKKQLTTRELLEKSTLMLMDKGNITRQHVDNYLNENHIMVRNCIEITSMDLLADFAKIGMGISSVIKEFVQEDLHNGLLIQIPQAKPMKKREIGFVYSDVSANEKAVKYFLAMINE